MILGYLGRLFSSGVKAASEIFGNGIKFVRDEIKVIHKCEEISSIGSCASLEVNPLIQPLIYTDNSISMDKQISTRDIACITTASDIIEEPKCKNIKGTITRGLINAKS